MLGLSRLATEAARLRSDLRLAISPFGIRVGRTLNLAAAAAAPALGHELPRSLSWSHLQVEGSCHRPVSLVSPASCMAWPDLDHAKLGIVTFAVAQ